MATHNQSTAMDRPHNILITGAAGYIGGSVLADLLSRTRGPISGATLHAVVRSEEQMHALSKLDANIIKLDLSDGQAVTTVIDDNQIDIIVHTASSIDHVLMSNLLQALGRRRAVAKTPVYFIHSSVTTWYSEEAGWPYGAIGDNESIYEKEKKLDVAHPVREANVLLVEMAKEYGITSFNLVIPNVHGLGSGEGRKVSILIPALIQASIKLKMVHKFDKDGCPPAAHISDIVALYGIVLERILLSQAIPNGEDGYYFAQAHRAPWWAYMEALSRSLHARGLVMDPEPRIWSNDKTAAQALNFPSQFIRAMGTASGGLEPINAYRLGWQPKWDEQMFLSQADEEVQSVLGGNTVQTSVFEKVMTNVDSQV